MKYKINKGFIVQKLDNKMVIFDGEESIIYTFNETASFIFKKLKSGVPEGDIVHMLIKRYGIKENKATKDLHELIADLKKKKIIT